MKKRIVYKCLSFLISLILIINSSLCSYADTASYSPALMPMYELVASILIATGVVATSNMTALNNLVDDVISEIKYSEVQKATSDDTYNSWYKVINNNNEPEKPNNNNKNGKWFALVGASSLGAAVAFEKGAVQDIVNTAKNLGAYQPMQGSGGIYSANDFKNNSTASAIALQLANISNSAVTQFDEFLHCSFWEDIGYTPDDCYFQVHCNIDNILTQNPLYPQLRIRIMLKNPNISYVDLSGSSTFSINTKTYNNQSKTYVYGYRTALALMLLDNNQASINLVKDTNAWGVWVQSRASGEPLTWSTNNLSNVVSSYGWGTNPVGATGTDSKKYVFCGYKWQNITDWNFTQNVYNNTNVINQYPEWDLSSIDLLNQNIEALRIGIQDLNKPWDNTQNGVQTSPVPDPVISQLINNWLNPENIPNPNPNPDPDPDPDPEPNPDPAPEPVPDSGYMEEFLLPSSITEKFPFCVPFDIVRCLRLFNTNSREAPVWTYDLTYGNNVSHIVLDLSIFDDVASFIRPIEYIGFLVGLAYATRYLIKG